MDEEADAFIASAGGNTRWLAVSDAPPGNPPGSTIAHVLVPREGAPVAVTSSLEGHRSRKECAVKDLRFFTHYPDISADGKTGADVLKVLTREMRFKTVLTDNGLKLQRGVKAQQSSLLDPLRAVKDAEELKRIRVAVRHADAGQRFARDLVECGKGLTELEVATEIDYFMRRRGVQENSFSTIVASGHNAAHSHHNNTGRRLRDGDPVICDFGVYWRGYCSDITRTFFVGSIAAPKWKRRYRMVLEANERSRAAAAAGVTCHTVDAAGRDYLREQGVAEYFVHGTGHGFGLEVHEFPAVTHDKRDVLADGTTFTVEPGLYFPGEGGIRIEDDVVITGKGSETLTHSRRDLY